MSVAKRFFLLFLMISSGAVFAQDQYVDDEDQRRLADLKFEADPQANNEALQIRVRAFGPQVDPIIGYRGIFGTNRYTAEELSLIAAGRRAITIETRYPNGLTVNGYAVPGQRGRVPERSLGPDGRIQFLSQSLTPQLLELNVLTRATAPGLRTTSIFVDGQLRFRVRWDLQDGQPQIRGVESSGSDHYLASRLPPSLSGTNNAGRQFLLVADEKKLPPPISVDVWKQYDLEGRWLQFKKGIVAKPASLPAWIAFLGDQREYQLLEWIALYVPDAFKSNGVGDLLLKKNAPQWLRVAIWHVNAPFTVATGHSRQTATDIVVNQQPGTALDYLLKNRRSIENWKAGVSTCLKQLMSADAGVTREDSSKLFPPLKSADIFAALYPPDDVADFGDRKQAEPDAVYQHQVVRAIQGVVVMNHANADRLAQLRKLTAHQNDEVRHAALLAFSVFAPKAPGTEEYADFRRVIDDASESARMREAALMAWSYHDHPAVLLKLHEIALDRKHPAWKAAVSRLGDLGQTFSVPLLSTLERDGLDEQQTLLLDSVVKRLADRFQPEKLPTLNEPMTRHVFRLAAYAGATDDPLAELVKEWAVVSARRIAPKMQPNFPTWLPADKPEIWLPVDYEKYVAEWKALQEQTLQR